MGVPDTFRTPVKEIHQLELTSRCNLKCSYCPSAKMQAKEPGFRDTVDMADDVFAAALDLVGFYVRAGTQDEVNIAGIGESTLLGIDALVDKLRRIRAVVGPSRKIHFSTNGLLVTEELAAAIAPFHPEVAVSFHVGIKRARPAVVALKRNGIYYGESLGAAEAPISWAQQVDWPDESPRFNCHWLTGGRAYVMADGRLGACSMDATGETSIGDVKALRDLVLSGRTALTGTSELCRKCHHQIPGWDQSKASKFDAFSPVIGFNVKSAP